MLRLSIAEFDDYGGIKNCEALSSNAKGFAGEKIFRTEMELHPYHMLLLLLFLFWLH